MALDTLHPRQVLGGNLPLLSPAFRRSHFRRHVPLRPQRRESSEKWNCGRERCPVVILPKFRLPRKFRDLLHAANLRHGTDGFTSPPKEGVLRIFFALKIRRLRPGSNPRTWVPKASTLLYTIYSTILLYLVLHFNTQFVSLLWLLTILVNYILGSLMGLLPCILCRRSSHKNAP